MSRSSYSDDYGDEFPGQLNLYRGNVRRSIQSKAGQARLRELREALLALPVKELEANTFVEGTRDSPRVCVLGAWALAKQHGDPQAAATMLKSADADDLETFECLAPHGWPKLVVLEAIYMNDEGDGWRVQTPAQRYGFVLDWVNRQIAEARP